MWLFYDIDSKYTNKCCALGTKAISIHISVEASLPSVHLNSFGGQLVFVPFCCNKCLRRIEWKSYLGTCFGIDTGEKLTNISQPIA